MVRTDLMRRVGHVVELGSVAAGSAIGGAIVEHFLDPDRGHSRRTRLRDEVGARTRSTVHHGQLVIRRSSHRIMDRARGELYGRLSHIGGADEDFDNVTLAQKVRSEALGHLDGALRHLSVDAVNGTVTLRGEVGSTLDSARVESAVRRVRGVHEVANLLHRRGELPPNKAAVLTLHAMTSP